MANFCLIKKKVNDFKKGLMSGELDPVKMSTMASADRRTLLEKYVGVDQAKNVNAEFESKLLLKNQQQGMLTWAKQVTGIKPNVRRDIITRISKMTEVLDPADKDMFLQDLVERRLEVSVTVDEASNIARMSKDITDTGDVWTKKLDENKTWSDNSTKTRTEWIKDTDRLEYGLKQVQLKNYVEDLKLQAKKITWKQPVRKIISIPNATMGVMKSVIASLDDSFFGRQGIKTILTGLNNRGNYKIWGSAFIKSFVDIKRQLLASGKWYKSGDDAVMDMIKADILSRPNAMSGKYKVGGYGLDILSEEAFPSSFPEKIPLFGRVFKASEVAYNAGALRMRADLADNLITRAEKNGVNTLNKAEAEGLGHLVGSMTGRGSLGKGEVLGKEVNVLLFSGKFLKGNIDSLTAHIFDKAVRENPVARKEAAKNLLSIITTMAGVMTISNILSPGSAETDPQGTNFGKIKIFGHPTDISGGMGAIVVLASRLVPTFHDGKWSNWSKNTNGKWTDLNAKTSTGKPVYGAQTAMDVFDSFWQGKLSPGAGVVRDLWKGQNYNGQPVTPSSVIAGQIPLPMQNVVQFSKDPNSSFVLGSWILDALGFSVSSTVPSNEKSGYIPVGQKMSNDNFIDAVSIYANAMGTDPVTAFNRIFTGQKITKVTNGTVIVERMPLDASQDIKKKANADNPTMKLEHLVPLEIGGSNDKSNLRVVTTSQWTQYTKVDNTLGKALKAGTINKSTAQKLALDVKNGKISAQSVIDKYK